MRGNTLASQAKADQAVHEEILVAPYPSEGSVYFIDGRLVDIRSSTLHSGFFMAVSAGNTVFGVGLGYKCQPSFFAFQVA
jgi:hypothetical protein